MNTHFLAFEQEAPTQPLQRLLDLNVYLNDNFCPSFFSSNSKTKIDAELMMKWAFPAPPFLCCLPNPSLRCLRTPSFSIPNPIACITLIALL